MLPDSSQNKARHEPFVMNKNHSILVFVLLGGLSGGLQHSAGAQITKVGDKYVFHVKFTKGQTIRYVMTTTAKPMSSPRSIAVSQNPLVTISPITMTTLDVKGKISTVQLSLGPMVMNGKEISKVQTAQMQIDDHNQAVNRAKGSPVGAGFPPDPIKVGGSYHADQSAVRNGEPIRIQGTYTFKGIKTVGGQQVAEIFAVTTTKSKVVTKGTNTIYLSVADGTLVSTTTRQTATTTNAGKPVSMTTDTVIARQK